LQGHDIVLVGSVENSYDQSVFARPGTMTRMEELKGKSSASAVSDRRHIMQR
jgi:hypothetical protein